MPEPVKFNPKSLTTVGDAMLYWSAECMRPDINNRECEVTLAIFATLCWAMGAPPPPDTPAAVEMLALMDRAAARGSVLRKAVSGR